MRPFRRHRGEFVASFDVAEVTLLTDLVGQIRTLLATRRDMTPIDPLSGLTGLSLGPSTHPDDPAVARLLPDFHRDDTSLAAGMRMLREPEVVAAKDDAAVALLGSLPSAGGTVHVDEAIARSWLVALNDLRLVFGVRLGVTEESEADMDALVARDGPRHAMYLTYRWLSTIQESLAGALLEALDDDR